MKTPPLANPWQHRKQRSRAFRHAVLVLFSERGDKEPDVLRDFSGRDWNSNLRWLDTSGLALYLLQRLTDLGRQDIMPSKILARLRQNQADNTVRNNALLAELSGINDRFQQENIIFASLKGITLSPDSVPDPALRCQLDLDFLVYAEHASAAGCVLESVGYKLACVSGDTWEYKTEAAQIATLNDLYKAKPQRSAELHLAPSAGPLDRVRVRAFGTTALPVLSPVDLYLHQADHLFKHVCSSFTRAAWLLEHRRHTLARRLDQAFWNEIEHRTTIEPRLALAVSVVTLLVVSSFGDIPPEIISRLISTHVPRGVRLWIETYWPVVILADFPGTKLYLLLIAELPPTVAANQTASRRDLLPVIPPPMITHRQASKTPISSLCRYQTQIRYILLRLRFHLVEGARYSVELSRFHRLLTGSAH